MLQHHLKRELVTDILDYMECPEMRPTLRNLNILISKYIRKIPWESVSRIVKRHNTSETRDCPRWPEEFWNDAIRYGFGGTCFESSLAFYSLLTSMGYEGYLTVNDMGDSRACHAAIVIVLKGKKYLVDNTIPVHSAVLLNPQKTSRRRTKLTNYTIRPVQENKYEIDRSHHPHRNAFTLIDVPISLLEYEAVVEKDYTDSGHFLKSVVMVKVIGERTWRFFSDHKPYRLENFNREGKNEIFIEPEKLSSKLAELFQMPEAQIFEAFSLIHAPLIHNVSQPIIVPSALERVTP